MKSLFAAVLLFLAGIFGGNHATPPPPTSTAAAAVAESQPVAPSVTPPAPQTTAPAQVIADATVSQPQAPAATRPAAATPAAVLTVPIDPDYVTPSQLAAALLGLQSSINQEIDSSTSTLAYGGLQNEISALSRINNLGPSTNAPLTITDPTFSGTVSGLTASEIPALNYFPASSTISIAYGGTGTSTAPIANRLLLSDANGNWEYVATSSLGILNGITSSQWASTGSTVSYTGGSVVIGTTTANHEFDVWQSNNTPIGLTTTDPALTVTNAGSTLGNGSTVAFQGVDTSGTEVTLARISDISTSLTAGAASGNLAFFTRNGGIQQQDLTILANGNVGIGTTSPFSLLSVAGQSAAQNFNAFSSTATSISASKPSSTGRP